MIQTALICAAFCVVATSAFAQASKMGRVLTLKDAQRCKAEGGMARGYALMTGQGMSHENAQVILLDHYGNDALDTIADVTNRLAAWEIGDGEDAQQVFEALCVWQRIGPIDVIKE